MPRTNKGTKYTPPKEREELSGKKYRSVYMYRSLDAAIEVLFTKGSKGPSDYINGGIVLMMAMDILPQVQKAAIEAAKRPDIGPAVNKVRDMLLAAANLHMASELVRAMPKEKQAQLAKEYLKGRKGKKKPEGNGLFEE